jgi:hypothetical protein
MAKPDPNAKPGQGGRFAALKEKLARNGASDPGALAASIGEKKYGRKRFTQMAQQGREDGK